MKKFLTGLFMAWGNFSVVPSPRKVWDEGCRKWMIALMPVIGLLTGVLQFCIYSIFELMHVRGMLAGQAVFQGAILTFIPFYLTGFIHLDGFMDTCDSLLSRREQKEMQRILKDSRVGAFSVICLVFMVLLYFGSVVAIQTSMFSWEKMFALACVPFAVRMVASMSVLRMKPLESSQYASMGNEDAEDNAVFAGAVMDLIVTVICVFGTWYLFGRVFEMVLSGFVAMLVSYVVIKNASKKIGGINGDIAGYGIVIGELAGAIMLGLCS